ncbi:MAG TPA: DUF4091 domain-containing protein [Armatimonadota bacterium]|mgnify:CR=1 FL=1|nr:DUF4091 domain-containing protein [Armatimonadota bacterium]HPT96981.1 DUF4091 domain-containing protein [Armatimonadota bacterium]
MAKARSIGIGLVSLLVAGGLLAGPRAADAGAADVRVYGVSALHKVLPDEAPASDWTPGRITLECAQNESEAFQVVVRVARPTSGLAIRASDLKGPRGGVLPASLVSLHKVEWVDINAPFDPKEPSLQPLLRPDPLPVVEPGQQFACEPGKNLAFWLAVAVPEDARPGAYTGQVEVLSGGRQAASLAVSLRVRDFALPKRPILQSMIGLSDGNIFRAHGAKTPEEKEKIIRLYFEEYIRARLSPFLYAPGTMAFNPLPDGAIRWEFVKDAQGQPTGEVKLDFTNFDREARRYFDERQVFSAFNFAPYILRHKTVDGKREAYLAFTDSNRVTIDGLLPDGTLNPVFEKAVVSFFRQVGAHLAEKGWLDRAVYYVTDEPPDSDTDLIKQVCLLVRRGDPRIRTALTYDPANRPRLAEVQENGRSLISLWIPYVSFYREEVAAAERAKGAEYWLYDVKETCLISHSGERNRGMFWDVWRRDAHGYLYYLATYWGRDATPWDRPSFLLPGVTYQYRHGDGYFFYPPRRQYDPDPPILDTVVRSIRWELMREGAEDFDTLRILERLTDQAEKRRLPAAAQGRKALALARSAAEAVTTGADAYGIRDLRFDAQPGWSFSAQEGWLHHRGGSRSDLVIHLDKVREDGVYELILNVYDDLNYRGQPYSRFLVNGKAYATPGGLKGATDVAAGTLEVRGGRATFTLSALDEQAGVILYRVGLKRPSKPGTSLYAARTAVFDAIEALAAALKQR